MIDSKLILTDKAFVKRELAKKGYDIEYIDAINKILRELRKQTSDLNELNKLRNASNRDASITKDDKRRLRQRISNAKKDFKALESYALGLLYDVPNLPDPAAPTGGCESSNVILFESQDYYKCRAPSPLPHWEIAEALDILDAQGASKISGSGFGIFKGKGAKLLRALINYVLELYESKYSELITPHLVASEALAHTGHLPKFRMEQYKCERDDLWLIPTAEVPLTASLSGTIFAPGLLPRRYMGYSLAFRRESGASGFETRGLQRVREFHKVELLKIVEPPMVEAELSELLEDCLRLIRDLGLQYRVVDLCAGEMGDKYARCYDIEVFSPGLGKWLEVSSVGHFSDYQARRAKIQYIDNMGKKRFACTMNGSGVAAARVWLSIIETYQQLDGSVRIPDVLVPFMGCEFIGR
ncbi:MAG: serine--tRNA ligase [Oscillospiraceae bacterium]|nr:serine--tRNA ligase [Oscillospiraceae bacterium]